MPTRFLLLIMLPLAVTLLCSAQAPQDPFDEALAQVGLSRETLRFDREDMANYGGDAYKLRLFENLHGHFFKIAPYLDVFQRFLLENAEKSHDLQQFASLRVDEGVRRGFVVNPLEEIEKSLDDPKVKSSDIFIEGLAKVFAESGKELSKEEQSRARSLAANVPDQILRHTGYILYSIASGLKMRKLAFENIKPNEYAQLGKETFQFLEKDIPFWNVIKLIPRVNFKHLYAGAMDISQALDRTAKNLKDFKTAQDFSFKLDTPYGLVALGGSKKNRYPELKGNNYLLILDTGGDDEYGAGGNAAGFNNPASFILDLAGNDEYQSWNESSPTFGAALFGYGYLYDLAGNDRYTGLTYTQGAGIFGVGTLIDFAGDDSYSGKTSAQGSASFGIGTLIDFAGDDSYSGKTSAQGSASFGIGILSDLAGNDKYYGFAYSQGFGFTKGLGLLLDKVGDDRYIADNQKIIFPSSQSDKDNGSLSQGFGHGLRADFTDGYSLAGGIGILVDGNGNDSYSAGVFAQGAGYWYGSGFLIDLAGDDSYDAIWYAQGSGAHFALGTLMDYAGNDTYKSTKNMAIGAGHDFSLGFLYDMMGNDTYTAPNLSLGGGNANGIGVFLDAAGDDTYNVAEGVTLGKANSATPRGGLRDFLISLGLFLDLGGNDKYPEILPLAKNNSKWTRPGDNTQEPILMEKGAGLDGDYPGFKLIVK